MWTGTSSSAGCRRRTPPAPRREADRPQPPGTGARRGPRAARRPIGVHGRQDRMTDPSVSARYAHAAAAVAESASYVAVAGEAHAMLRRARLWHDLATGFVLAVMCGRSPGGTPTRNGTNEKTTEAST